MARCHRLNSAFCSLALTALASSPVFACLQSTREACCQGSAPEFEESMVRQCRLQDCQFSLDGSTCESPGSYTQCLQAASCPTAFELESTAGTLNSSSATEILLDPCSAFPDATTCHRLIDWCCNGATVVVDGQAIYLTLVTELSTIVEADFDVVCNVSLTQPWSRQANISVLAPTRDLSCNVSLDVSHIHCDQSLPFSSTETTMAVNATDRAWAEVTVDLPFRGSDDLVEVPDSVADALDAEVAQMFSQAGVDDANESHVDLSHVDVEIIFDVDVYLDYAEVRAAVEGAILFYGPSFVHSTTTFAHAGTTTTTALSAAQMIADSSNSNSPSSTTVIVGATAAAAVVVAALIAAVVIIVRKSARNRIARSRSRLAVTSTSLDHAHDDVHLTHRHEKKHHRKSHRPSGTRSQKVADASHVVPEHDGNAATTNKTKSDQPLSEGAAVFHKRGSSISEITAELADVAVDAQRECEEVIPVTDLDNLKDTLGIVDEK